ncbi:MAG: SEL1-like repeat protein [Planctomycetes bacterium]|nr:SEL1-like repeat protein [Planctomycetota bacterium]
MKERIGPYEILEELARGGQGLVLRAKHSDLGTPVAVKVLLDLDPESLARFQREGKTLARLRHPNLLRVDALGFEGGTPYMAMELVRGQDLADRVRREGPLSLEALGSTLGVVSRTLHYCHENGIVHRDLKPQNVMIEAESGRVLLVDFGLIRRDRLRHAWATQDEHSLTQEGTILGTPAYMPPEQVSAEFGSVDRRSDVYSLGALLYFLLTGEQPFAGPTLVNVLIQVLESAPPDPRRVNPAIPDGLAELCLQCMAKPMDERPLSAEVFADELEACLLERPGPTRRPGLALALSLGGILLLLLAGSLVWQASEDSPPTVTLGSPTWPPRPSPSPSSRPSEHSSSLFGRGVAALEANRDRDARDLFRRAAEEGHVQAMLDLAALLGSGGGGTRNRAEAARWFRRAADLGNAEAMYRLAVSYQKGLGVPRDEAQAAEWYRRAGERGHARGMFGRGLMLEEGLGVTKDEAKAAAWYRRATRLGHRGAIANLGALLGQGRGVPKDEAQAVKLLRRAADMGDATAMWNLGGLLERGSTVLPKDLPRALEWYRLAAAEGDLGAMARLGGLLITGHGPKGTAEGVAWLWRGAKAGHPGAMYGIGLALQEGIGVPQDKVQAAKWFRSAAKMGHAEAMANLGQALQWGTGVPRDPAQAELWYRRAAKQNNGPAMSFLGKMLATGDGLAKDEAQAVKWFRRAGEAGYLDGVFNMALMLLSGRGVAKDPPRAAELFRRCARVGHVDAMFSLGRLLEDGNGVAKDAVQAATWFRRVSLGNDPDLRHAARAALKRLREE